MHIVDDAAGALAFGIRIIRTSRWDYPKPATLYMIPFKIGSGSQPRASGVLWPHPGRRKQSESEIDVNVRMNWSIPKGFLAVRSAGLLREL